MRRLLFLVIIALLLVPVGQAQFHKALPFESTSGFTDDLGSLPAVLSGAVDYQGEGAANATLLLGTGGLTVSGLERLCWEESSGGDRCVTDASGGLSVELADGGSVAFRTPKTYDVSLEADHTLAFFADASQMFGDDRSENIAFGESLIAFPTQETIRIDDVAPLPVPPKSSYSSFNDAVSDLALLITLSDTSTLTLRSGGTELDTLTGNGQWVGFQGGPAFTPVTADVAALPMPDGSTASFTRADRDAAREGLASGAFSDAVGSVEESEGQGDADALSGLEDAADILAGFLTGAYISFGTGDVEGEGGPVDLLETATFVRFTEMDATRSQGQVAYSGSAPLQIEDGEVAGANELVGGFIPFMAIVLWGLAVALLLTRTILRAGKHNELWDKLHWIGWIAGPVASIIAFILWDMAMADLWGVSLLTSNVSGTAQGAIAALEIVPLILAGLFFGVPTRILVGSLTRVFGQGRMMNIGGVIAPFVVLAFGIPLMLSFVAAILDLAPGFAG